MISAENLKAYYETDFGDKLSEFKLKRIFLKTVRGLLILFGAIGIIAFMLTIFTKFSIVSSTFFNERNSYFIENEEDFNFIPLLAFGSIFLAAICFIVFIRVKIKYIERYKKELYTDIVNKIYPEWTKSENAVLNKEKFNGSDIFKPWNKGYGERFGFTSLLEDIPFTSSQAYLKVMNDSIHEFHYEFDGLFFCADIDYDNTKTVISQRYLSQLVAKNQREVLDENENSSSPVSIENQYFTRHFRVFSTSPDSSAEILNSKLTDLIVDFRKKYDADVCFSVANTKFHSAIDLKKHCISEGFLKGEVDFKTLSAIREFYSLTEFLTKEFRAHKESIAL